MDLLHIVLHTDSLSIPRPWDLKSRVKDSERDFHFAVTYPALLQARLNVTLPKANVAVTNLGKFSGTMVHAAAKAHEIFSLYNPHLVILQHGVVDGWIRTEKNAQSVDVPLQAFYSELKRFLQKRDELLPEAKVIIIGVAPTNNRVNERRPEQSGKLQVYNAALRRVATEHKLAFLDVVRAFGHDPEQYLAPDGVHYSRDGHQVIASRLVRIIVGLFPDLASTVARERDPTKSPRSADDSKALPTAG